MLDRSRPEYQPHVFAGNMWLCAAQHLTQGIGRTASCFTRHIASYHLIERGALWFPAWLSEDTLGADRSGVRRPNLSPAARRYLERLDLTVEDLFHHVLAVLHDPAYRRANAGALRMEWPRIPLPHWDELSAASVSATGQSTGRPQGTPLHSFMGASRRSWRAGRPAPTRDAPTALRANGEDTYRLAARPLAASRPSPPPPPAVANWPRCWTPRHRFPASPPVSFAPRFPPSPCPPPPTATTCPATTSP